MASKDKLKAEFIGMNAESVTGSMTLISGQGLNILLEAGLYQSNDVAEDYRVNNRNLNISLKKLDFIIVGHVHADHSMLIPRLVAEGCRARIIVPKGTKGFFKLLGLDSAFIIDRDCEALENKYNKSFHRMYTADDVFTTLDLMEEYEFGEKIELSDRLTIRYTPAGHITNSAQTELWISNEIKNRVSKILYTSDLGNIRVPKYYTAPFERVEKANLVIAESTYSQAGREVSKQTRAKDLQKMREVIKYCEGIVEIPVFAMDRCPNILTILYDIFGNDPDFTKDVVVDSPLTVKMLKELAKELNEDDLEKLDEVLSWENLKLIEEGSEHKSYMAHAKNCVVLSASGMMSKGRSRAWLKNIIEDTRNVLMFVGYASENTLAYKVKNGKEIHKIMIDGVEYKNRCKVVDLKSFSSHMQYSDMLDYYSSISTDKIALVHGEFNSKCEFGKVLQERISKKNGRARVVIVNRATTLNL